MWFATTSMDFWMVVMDVSTYDIHVDKPCKVSFMALIDCAMSGPLVLELCNIFLHEDAVCLLTHHRSWSYGQPPTRGYAAANTRYHHRAGISTLTGDQ
jgi:hypothetical protein